MGVVRFISSAGIKKKSTFRNRNRFPFRFREPYDPRRSPIWFPGSFLRRFLPRIQTPHLQTKCRLPLILFSVVLLPVVTFFPPSLRWLFPKGYSFFFFPQKERKMLTAWVLLWKWLSISSFLATRKGFSFAYLYS